MCKRLRRLGRTKLEGTNHPPAELVHGAVVSGEIHLEGDPLDLLRALAGVANISSGPHGKQAAKRMVDILMAGIRART